jgi:hypothetical protein
VNGAQSRVEWALAAWCVERVGARKPS